MSTCAISRLVRSLDSRVLDCGGGDEESEEEVTEMTSWWPVSRFSLRLDEAQTRKGRRRREASLTRRGGSLDRENDGYREAPA